MITYSSASSYATLPHQLTSFSSPFQPHIGILFSIPRISALLWGFCRYSVNRFDYDRYSVSLFLEFHIEWTLNSHHSPRKKETSRRHGFRASSKSSNNNPPPKLSISTRSKATNPAKVSQGGPALPTTEAALSPPVPLPPHSPTAGLRAVKTTRSTQQISFFMMVLTTSNCPK